VGREQEGQAKGIGVVIMREESMRASSQMLGAGSLMPAWGAQRGRYRGLIFFFLLALGMLRTYLSVL